jgi:hypothetical protein
MWSCTVAHSLTQEGDHPNIAKEQDLKEMIKCEQEIGRLALECKYLDKTYSLIHRQQTMENVESLNFIKTCLGYRFKRPS